MRTFTGIEVIRRDNVRKLLAHNQLSRGDLAEGAKINYALLGHYIGRNPTKAIGDDIASRIEEYFNKPTNWLDHEHADLGVDGEDGPKPRTTAKDIEHLTAERDDSVIFYMEEHENSGFADISGIRMFPRDFLPSRGMLDTDLYILRATDDSMAPYIKEGDDVGVDTGDLAIVDGAIYALKLNGSPMVKQIFVEADGGLVLHSYNEEYRDKVVPADKLESVEIFGKQFYRAG